MENWPYYKNESYLPNIINMFARSIFISQYGPFKFYQNNIKNL